MCQQTHQPTVTQTVAKKCPVDLNSLRKSIPAECYVKDLRRSLQWMVFDFAMWGLSVAAMYTFSTSDAYATSPVYVKALATIAHSMVAGFFMWCIFVVGHDCGHTTFSNYKVINDFIGHVTHGALLVLYWPWQLSHSRHHLNHNHEYKDYSHPWWTPEKLNNPKAGMARFFNNAPLARLLFPILGWPMYLIGFPDGSHFVPLVFQRLYKKAPSSAPLIRCLVSTTVVVAYATLFWKLCGSDMATFAQMYLGSYFTFGWWLTTVTYLQHHGEDTVVYDDSTWAYVLAGFETVDRTYGWPIDLLSHHITNGHVVHHLFFTKIPHYNLMKATHAMRAHLKEKNCEELYKLEPTQDFAFRVFKYFYSKGFNVKLVSESADRKSKVN